MKNVIQRAKIPKWSQFLFITFLDKLVKTDAIKYRKKQSSFLSETAIDMIGWWVGQNTKELKKTKNFFYLSPNFNALPGTFLFCCCSSEP